MSYYTTYSLKVDPNHDGTIIEQFRKESGGAEYAIFDNGQTRESCSWHDHEKDLLKFSKKYPDEIFELSGEGEEMPDLWRKYFKNGKMQTCIATITYPPYDGFQLR